MEKRNLAVEFFEYSNVETLLNCREYFDIAFLDVEIDDINGIDIGKALKKTNQNIVIFIVTAYEKYMDEAMDLNVLRFLQKPVDTQRLYGGLQKAIDSIDNSLLSVPLKDDDGVVNMYVNDIMYVEIAERKTKVVTKDNIYFSKNNMGYWRKSLVASFFCEPHKSFIVNIKYITRCCKDTVILKNGDKIPVSSRRQTEFQKHFIDFFRHE